VFWEFAAIKRMYIHSMYYQLSPERISQRFSLYKKANLINIHKNHEPEYAIEFYVFTMQWGILFWIRSRSC